MKKSEIDARVRSPSGMVTVVGSAIALCIMGDSLMYSVLPLYAVSVGLALPLVGILLSANRLIRLISNQWAGKAFELYGARLPFLASVLLGLLSTFAYGIPAGFVAFLLARIAWGIAWSGLRQGGYVATWFGRPAVRGRLTGLLLGLVRLGSAIGVVVGGVLYDRFGFVVAVGAVAVIGTLAIPLAANIPWQARNASGAFAVEHRVAGADSSVSWWQSLSTGFQEPALRWLSIASFFTYMVGGIIVSTTSIFVASKAELATDTLVLGIGIATVTGLLHGVRWMTNLVIGPLVGAVSDRIGKSNVLVALGLLMLGALLVAGSAQPVFAIIVFLFVLLLDGSLRVVVSATASTVATDTDHPHRFVATFATLTDAGSALGPLIAFSALATTQLPIVYGTGATVTLVCFAKFWQADRNQRQHVHLARSG